MRLSNPRASHVRKGHTLSLDLGALALTCCVAVGCDGAPVPGGRDAAGASTDAARPCPVDLDGAGVGVPPPSFRTEVLPLFGARCNFGGCHLGTDEPGQLRLGPSCELDVATSTCRVTDAGLAPELAEVVHANLLSPALAAPALRRVEPGAPRASFLLHKLAGCQLSLAGESGCTLCGEVMPPGAPLRETAPADFERLAAWIAAGAPLD